MWYVETHRQMNGIITQKYTQTQTKKWQKTEPNRKNIKNKLFIRIFLHGNFSPPSLSLSLLSTMGPWEMLSIVFFLFFSIVKNTRVGYFFLDCVTAKNKNMYSFSPCIYVPCDLLLIGCFSLWMCVWVVGKKC